MIRWLCLCVMFWAESFSGRLHGQPLVESIIVVERIVFCRSVTNLMPVNPIREGTVAIPKGEPLYIWMEIRGDLRALRMLEYRRSLPVYYAWKREGAGHTGLVDIGIKEKNWKQQLDGLKSEMVNAGYWTWRTKGYSCHLSEGNWEITLLDANKRIVPFSPPPHGRVCRPKITVKFHDN